MLTNIEPTTNRPGGASIRVRFFAQAKEATGIDGLHLDIKEAQSVGQLILELNRRYPKLLPVIQRSALAVNRHYVTQSHLVGPGDELAIIPPVAGG